MQTLTQTQREAIDVLVPSQGTLADVPSNAAARSFAVLRGHNPSLARYLFSELVNCESYGHGGIRDYTLIDVWLSSVVRMGLQFDDMIEYTHWVPGGHGVPPTRARAGVALVRGAPYFPRAVYNASMALFRRTVAESAERLRQNTGTPQDRERVERGTVGLAQELLLEVCNDRYMHVVWETATNQGTEQKGFLSRDDTPGEPEPRRQAMLRDWATYQLEFIMAEIIGLCLVGAQADTPSLHGTTLWRFFEVVDEFPTEKADAEENEDMQIRWRMLTRRREFTFPAQLHHEVIRTWLEPARDLADFMLRPFHHILTNAETTLPWLLDAALPAREIHMTTPFEVLLEFARRIRLQFRAHVASRALPTVAERAVANPRVRTLFLATDEYSQYEILELMVNDVLFPVFGTNGWRSVVSGRQIRELWESVMTEFVRRESEAQASRKKRK